MRSWNRWKLLDLFGCEGIGAEGYNRARWLPEGVDIDRNRLKRYPFKSHLADALAFARKHGHKYDAGHASPPCQGYTRGNAGKETDWPLLIPQVREVFEEIGFPYVIENVEDAAWDMKNPILLCGCMFGLSTIDTDGLRIHLRRTRLFETNWDLPSPGECDHSNQEWVAGAYGGARRDKYDAKYVRKGGYVPPDMEVVKALLGVRHDVTWKGLYECIPPAYTEYIGTHLRDAA